MHSFEAGALAHEEQPSVGPNGRANGSAKKKASHWRRRWRTLALVASDQLAVLTAVVVAHVALDLLWPGRPWPGVLQLLSIVSPGALLAFSTHDLYGAPRDDIGLELRRVTLASSSLFGLLLLVSLADGRVGTWSGSLTAIWFLCPFFVLSYRAFARQVRSRLPGFKQKVLVLGDGEEGRSICYWLSHRAELGLVPVGPLGGPWSYDAVEEYARKAGAVHIVVTPSAAESRDLTRRLSDGTNGFEDVTIVPEIAAYAPMSASRRLLGSTWGVSSFPLPFESPWTRGVKRAVDYGVGLPLLVLALPLIGALALCIKLVSPGSAIFRHRRVGRDGREFDVFKLRSMCTDADERLQRYLERDPAARREWERHFKLEKDPRLLPVIGPLLRKTSLDELPQLLNVLRGEMSLVGPRPLPPYHIASLSPLFCARRHRVPPGLTGLWQVSERSNGDLEDLMRLDEYYLNNWSIWLDLRILGATAWAVIRGKGAV
jgi:exopolysaccharide biosynthesis polyprenyl glycosylphosphotransferase